MMWGYLITIVAFGSLFVAAIRLASKQGSKAAQLESLKAELKKQAEEQKRANQIMDRVRNMPSDAVRQRLHHISSK